MPRPRKRSRLGRVSVTDLAAELARRRTDIPALLARYSEVVDELDIVETAITALGGTFDPKHRQWPRETRGRRGASLARDGAGKRASKGSARGAGKRAGKRAAGGRTRRTRARNDSSLAEALAKVLSGQTLSVSDAAAAVQKAGYSTTSPNIRTMVNAALLDKKKFKRVARGMYTAV